MLTSIRVEVMEKVEVNLKERGRYKNVHGIKYMFSLAT
jgi:hypothetical protein